MNKLFKLVLFILCLFWPVIMLATMSASQSLNYVIGRLQDTPNASLGTAFFSEWVKSIFPLGFLLLIACSAIFSCAFIHRLYSTSETKRIHKAFMVATLFLLALVIFLFLQTSCNGIGCIIFIPVYLVLLFIFFLTASFIPSIVYINQLQYSVLRALIYYLLVGLLINIIFIIGFNLTNIENIVLNLQEITKQRKDFQEHIVYDLSLDGATLQTDVIQKAPNIAEKLGARSVLPQNDSRVYQEYLIGGSREIVIIQSLVPKTIMGKENTFSNDVALLEQNAKTPGYDSEKGECYERVQTIEPMTLNEDSAIFYTYGYNAQQCYNSYVNRLVLYKGPVRIEIHGTYTDSIGEVGQEPIMISPSKEQLMEMAKLLKLRE